MRSRIAENLEIKANRSRRGFNAFGLSSASHFESLSRIDRGGGPHSFCPLLWSVFSSSSGARSPGQTALSRRFLDLLAGHRSLSSLPQRRGVALGRAGPGPGGFRASLFFFW